MWKVWNKVKGRCVKPFYRHTLPAQYLGSDKIKIARFAKAAPIKQVSLNVNFKCQSCLSPLFCLQTNQSCLCTMHLWAFCSGSWGDYANGWICY